MANSSNQPSHPLRSEPTSKPAGLHLNNRLRLSHDRGPPKTIPYKIQGTDMGISGDSPLDFKGVSEAERWYAQNVSGKFRGFVVPHGVVSIGGASRLLLGPVDYGW